MKRELDMLKKESSQSLLDESERQALRDSLISYMDRNPVHDEVVESTKKASGYGTTNALLTLLLLIIFGVGGIAYAAESTVPGDSLYTFKRTINEPVQSFFAFSDQSKANLDVDLTNERLIEAEKLQSASRLTASAETSLSKDLNHQVSSFQQHVKVLSAENNDTAAIDAESHLEASLQAHAGVVPMLMSGVSLNGIVNPPPMFASTASSTNVSSSTIAATSSSSKAHLLHKNH